MSHTPPVPEAAQSIYPIEEPPHAHDEGGEALKAARELTEAKARRSASARQIGMGAAIGIGSAAIVAGLLYWRGGRR
ncbi:MAG: hypothetical protein EOP60_10765 [Sphingomonadales bacterium]|nr:MAG: hypothetical protein EOP60_10765 [Sphingomonadales bacterium]